MMLLEHLLGEEQLATPDEWVSLFTMLLFSTVLFTKVDTTLPMWLWYFVSVHNYKVQNFREVASEVHAQSITGRTGCPSITGCPFALMRWLT